MGRDFKTLGGIWVIFFVYNLFVYEFMYVFYLCNYFFLFLGRKIQFQSQILLFPPKKARCRPSVLRPSIALQAYLSEITDHSNVGTGIGLLGMQWSLGQTLGPLIGGALARPARKYAQYLPALDAPFFHDFPYALACALPVVLGLLAFVPTLLWLPETRCHDASTVVEDVDGDVCADGAEPCLGCRALCSFSCLLSFYAFPFL